MKRNPEAVAEAIREARKIAIVSHVNPDGDTIGCAAAMRLGLLSMGKEVEMFCEDLLNYANGLAMKHVVDRKRGY